MHNLLIHFCKSSNFVLWPKRRHAAEAATKLTSKNGQHPQEAKGSASEIESSYFGVEKCTAKNHGLVCQNFIICMDNFHSERLKNGMK